MKVAASCDLSIIPADEPERLAAVRRYDVLDTPPDGAFDRITAIAARRFGVPIAIISVVDQDRIWFVETGVQPNRVVGFDTKTSSWFSVTPISQSGGGTVRHMVFHRPTRTLWFGTDANTIARVKVP